MAEFELDASSRVLDLAAGTGQAARLFAGQVGAVVAVEPSAPMRRVLAERLPDVEVLDGQAERLPLADGSIDAAIVGNAFHWFAGAAAVDQLARVLRPGGGLALLWNLGLDTDPPAPELDALVDARRSRALPSARRTDSGAWRSALDETERFAPLRYREYLHERALDRETFVAYIASLAFIAALPPPEREPFLAQVRALAPAECRLSLRAECYWTRRSADDA
jgi:ubiquinone/menaquinone biosynthesis C-methylase UbiE